MNEILGLGTCKHTPTHIVSTWSDGLHTFAHAVPVKRQPTNHEVETLEALIKSLSDYDGTFKYDLLGLSHTDLLP